MMSWTLIALLVLGVLVFALALIAKELALKAGGAGNFQYRKIDGLFTAAERSFLGVLKLSVSNEVEVFGKVRVADVITPRKGQSRSDWQKAFNKISSKHFDFLLCSKGDLSILCAIELNDKSHHSKKVTRRDKFLQAACKSAGVPLIQIPAKATYQVTTLSAILSEQVPELGLINARTDTKAAVSESTPKSTQAKANAEKVCPKCSSTMVVKIAKSSKNAGRQFWACSAFPKCRHIEAKRDASPRRA